MRCVNQENSTSQAQQMQELAHGWLQQIELLLPTSLDESAKEQGALIRKRGFKSASSLLKLLLIYAASMMSVRMLSLCAVSLGIADISDSAMTRRLKQSAVWLAYLLDYLLPELPKEKLDTQRVIHLIDASNVAEAGSKGKVFRLHTSYNLNIGSMDEVKVTDKHTAESFEHFCIQKNHIYIADSGYGKAKMYDYVTSRGADAIIRFTPNHITLKEDKNKPVDMAQKLDRNKKVIDFTCYAVYNRKLIPVRIIASQLPEDKKADAIKRKKRQAQKEQTKNMRPETLLYAEWVIIMTSLDESYTAKEVLDIYRSRWQVELLFKRIKQHFKVTKIRPCTQKHGEALVLLWLIIWTFVEKQAYLAERYMLEKEMDMSRYFPWAANSYFFQRTKMLIDSLWATCLDPETDIEIIAKKLLNHKQDRVNKYFQYHFCGFLESTACCTKSKAA